MQTNSSHWLFWCHIDEACPPHGGVSWGSVPGPLLFFLCLLSLGHLTQFSWLQILSRWDDSNLCPPGPTFPPVPEPHLNLPSWQSPLGHLRHFSDLSGDISRGPLCLASPAAAGADLCWCPPSAREGQGEGICLPRLFRSPSCSLTQSLLLLLPFTRNLMFCQSYPWHHSYLLLHVFWIRVSSINRILSAFYHLWLFSKFEAFWLCFFFFF